jgi:hypothetical protein
LLTGKKNTRKIKIKFYFTKFFSTLQPGQEYVKSLQRINPAVFLIKFCGYEKNHVGLEFNIKVAIHYQVNCRINFDERKEA